MGSMGWAAVLASLLTISTASEVPGYWTLKDMTGKSTHGQHFMQPPAAECLEGVFELRSPAESAAGGAILTLPRQLTIAPGPRAVTIVDGCGNTRTFDTSGRVQYHTYGAAPSQTMTRWEGRKLVQEIVVDPDESIVLSFAAGDDELLVTEIVHTASRLPATVIYRYASDALR